MRVHSSVRFIAVLLLAATLPGIAHASKARVDALGVQPDYIVDFVNVHTYPSALIRHQNLVVAELGVIGDSDASSDFSDDNPQAPAALDSDRSLSVHLGNLWDGRLGVFGIYVNELATELGPTLGQNYLNRNSNESWNFIWANRWDNLSLGLEVNRSNSNLDNEQGGADTQVKPFTPSGGVLPMGSNGRTMFNHYMSAAGRDDWNTLGIGAGLSVEWEGGDYENFLDISGEIRSYTFEEADRDPAVGTTFEDDGSVSFAFNARAQIQASDDLTWVPVGNISRLDLSTMFTDAVTPLNNVKYDNTITTVNFGIAGNWTLRENDQLWVGVNFQTVSIEFENLDDSGGGGRSASPNDTVDVTYTQLPNIFIAFDGEMFSWLSIRLGASKPIYSKFEQENVNGETVTREDSPFLFSVGVGLHFGNFHIDALLNQDWPFEAGPLARGDDDVIPFQRLSATYRF